MFRTSTPISKRRPGRLGASSGFNLVELVMRLVTVSGVAVAATPVLFSRPTFDTRRFADPMRTATQYARYVAVVQGRKRVPPYRRSGE